MHGKEQAAHRGGQFFKQMLAHQHGTVLQLRCQVQAFIDNGQDHAPDLQQTAEKGQHRPERAFVLQIAPGQDKIAQAGVEGIEIFGHALKKKI